MTLEQRITALAQATGADIKALQAGQGVLSNLSTAEKSSLVAAINEVKSAVAGAGGPGQAGRLLRTAMPVPGATTLSTVGVTLRAVGQVAAATMAAGNVHTATPRLNYQVTIAAANAVAGVRSNVAPFLSRSAGTGFRFVCRFGPSTASAAGPSVRLFAGVRAASGVAPVDSDPSGLPLLIGVGADAADANFQFIVRDSAAAFKVDTGIPKTAPAGTEMYEVEILAPAGVSTVALSLTRLSDGTVFSNEISGTALLPPDTAFFNPYAWISVGGVSSTIGLALAGMSIESNI